MTETKKLWTLAADFGEGLERHMHWLTTETEARRSYDRYRFQAAAPTALVDSRGRIVVDDRPTF